jgi:hypothetical protein
VRRSPESCAKRGTVKRAKEVCIADALRHNDRDFTPPGLGYTPMLTDDV